MVRKNIKEKMNYKAEILKSDYKKACDAYLHRFCELIEMDEYYADWIDLGATAEVGDYVVSMQDIMTVVENNINYGKFIEWYDYTMRVGMLGLHTCNLKSWLNGCPTHSEDCLEKIESIRAELDRLIDEEKNKV